MKREHDDSLRKALALLERTVPGEDHALTGSSRSPASCDIGDLFLAELQARRERLRRWINLLNEEAGLSSGRLPTAGRSRHKCKGLALPPGAEQRLGVRRHSTAA
jgi:hypothetical protein